MHKNLNDRGNLCAPIQRLTRFFSFLCIQIQCFVKGFVHYCVLFITAGSNEQRPLQKTAMLRYIDHHESCNNTSKLHGLNCNNTSRCPGMYIIIYKHQPPEILAEKQVRERGEVIFSGNIYRNNIIFYRAVALHEKSLLSKNWVDTRIFIFLNHI